MTELKRRGRPSFVLPYEEARQIVKSKNFSSKSEYIEWVNTENPEGFSRDPYQTYRLRGDWVSYSHFLGKEDSITSSVNQDYQLEINSGFFSYLKDTLKNIIQMRLRNHSYMN